MNVKSKRDEANRANDKRTQTRDSSLVKAHTETPQSFVVTKRKREEEQKTNAQQEKREREEREADLPRWKAQTYVFAHSNQRAVSQYMLKTKQTKLLLKTKGEEEKRTEEKKGRGASRPHYVLLRKLKR